METLENQYQRRAIVGDRHFIQADPDRPDVWALPGPVVYSEDENGVRSFGPARTIRTAELQAWAASQKLRLRIDEKFPIVRRGWSEALAA